MTSGAHELAEGSVLRAWPFEADTLNATACSIRIGSCTACWHLESELCKFVVFAMQCHGAGQCSHFAAGLEFRLGMHTCMCGAAVATCGAQTT